MLLCWSCCEGEATDAGEFDCGVWYDIGGYGGLGICAAAIMSVVSIAKLLATLIMKWTERRKKFLPADVYPLVAPGVLYGLG